MFIGLCLVSQTQAQITILDTIHSTNNNVSWLKFDGYNHFAWYDSGPIGTEVFQYRNDQLDTLFVNPIYDACNTRGALSISKNKVLWSISDSSDPNCKHTFTWQDGLGIVEDQFGYLYIDCDNDEGDLLVDIAFSNYALDLDNGILSALPQLTSASYSYNPSNICSIAGDVLWFKAFRKVLGTGASAGQSIIRFNQVTGVLDEIFSSSNFLHFRETDYPDKLAFTESLADNSRNIYFFNGSTVQFVLNAGFSNVQTFNNGFLYRDYTVDDSVHYWQTDGTSTQLHADAEILNQSNCYISYFEFDDSNASAYKSRLYITDGMNTEVFEFDGLLRRDEFTLEGNNFVAEISDLTNGINHIIQGRHNLSCPFICPEDEVFVDAWNNSNFLFTKSIHSEAEISTSIGVDYEASDYILLSGDFQVSVGAVFLADIVSCP